MQNIRTLYNVALQNCHSELTIAQALSLKAETQRCVIPVLRLCSGQAPAGIQVLPPGFRVSLRSPGMTDCPTSWLGNENLVSEQRSEESQIVSFHKFVAKPYFL